MHVCRPGEESELFTFPKNYSELIDSLSLKVDAKVNDASQHYRDPSAKGYEIAIQIKEIEKKVPGKDSHPGCGNGCKRNTV